MLFINNLESTSWRGVLGESCTKNECMVEEYVMKAEEYVLRAEEYVLKAKECVLKAEEYVSRNIKSAKERSLDYATKDVQAIKHKMSKAKERCMTYFRSLHSHLQVLSNEELKGTHTEHGFKRAFISLFGQDVETFTSMVSLYVDQPEKKLDKDEF
ncbi:hypothetical protein Tco_1379535 [Tanacetum coccineum]